MNQQTISLNFFDEEGNDITELVVLTNCKASPWHSSGVFAYQNPILGDIHIGSHSSGNILMRDGYSYTKKPLEVS